MSAMEVTFPDGSVRQMPILSAGKVVRICVGEPGSCATLWRVWSSKTAADVYVGASGLIETMKFSFHASGDWRYTWSSRELALQHGGRIIDRWGRPADPGWAKMLTIYAPSEDVIPGPSGGIRPRDDTIWVPNAGPGEITLITICVTTPDFKNGSASGLVPLGGLEIANGDLVVVFAGRLASTPEAVKSAERARREYPWPKDPATYKGMVRLLVESDNEHGDRYVWDLMVKAADQPPLARESALLTPGDRRIGPSLPQDENENVQPR